MLSAHYRSPLNFSADLVEASKNGLERILTAVDKLKSLAPVDVVGSDVSVEAELDGYTKRFEAAMDDDLNTAVPGRLCVLLLQIIKRLLLL